MAVPWGLLIGAGVELGVELIRANAAGNERIEDHVETGPTLIKSQLDVMGALILARSIDGPDYQEDSP
ncbi:MAG: hypothetical protein AAF183_13080 [Pseudomonadota bacterium]